MDTLLRLGGLVLLALGVVGCWPGERPEVSYANMPEAVSHGVVDRGWIPEWIPASATNIHEIHDLDTNESMLAFQLPATASWSLPPHCQPVSYSNIGPPRFSRSWWPTPEEQESSYNFHRCAGDDPSTPKLQWVARHKSGNQGLYWRAYAR